jgi:hypothetical protein
MRSAIAAWQWIYDYLRSFLVASMVIGFVASFWRMEGLRWTFGAIIAAYLGNMFLYSIASDPANRYQMVSTAMSAFAAGPGIYFMICWPARALISFMVRKVGIIGIRIDERIAMAGANQIVTMSFPESLVTQCAGLIGLRMISCRRPRQSELLSRQAAEHFGKAM